MKKVLFVLPHMLCGGVEKALLALVHELPRDKFDISIMVVKSEGDFVRLIPDYAHYSEIPMDEEIRNGLMLGGIKASLIHYVKKTDIANFIRVTMKVLKKDPFATLLCDFSEINPLPVHYDIAVCFHIHMPFLVQFVAKKVNADVKYAWIHNDFKMSGFDVTKIKDSLNVYNYFFAVSEQLLEEFLQIFPEYKGKASVAYNIISEKYIRSRLGDQVPEYSSKGIKLLTIGRLDEQKGYDLAVKACQILKKRGIDINWYVLGNGGKEKQIRRMIDQCGVSDCFHLLGIRINPYPYIDQCDIYVQPSKHEGYGIAVAEARILNKAIVCTNFTGARDQIVHNQTGLIVGIDANAIAKGIERIIYEKGLKKRLEVNLAVSSKTTTQDIEKIISFF